MTWRPTRRGLFRTAAAAGGAGILQACTGTGPQQPSAQSTPQTPPQTQQPQTPPSAGKGTVLRLIAPSGFAPDPNRATYGINRLTRAGFTVENTQAAYRRSQRFAGTDEQRAADLQELAAGRAPMPQVIMGMRGGYGAQRLLPLIDFASLGAKMREQGTLFFGFSDICALQLALLAKSGCPSFAGPMVYSEFGNPNPSAYTMDSFIRCTTQSPYGITVPQIQRQDARLDGILWGGNLSVLAALAGSPYLPDINGGILFLEDVGEQPYRIERMLQTLLLAGVLKKQQAVIFGDFRMGSIRDVYDPAYDLTAVISAVGRAARIPVLTGFPFGHISNKASFPLGVRASVRPDGNGGYTITFADYPRLNPALLQLSALLQPDPAETGAEDNADYTE
ncbi:MAG: LD-carboxypeptidase [Neisseria sp.]|nr:LD-carboxypeptidase [Neisseria sp.]